MYNIGKLIDLIMSVNRMTLCITPLYIIFNGSVDDLSSDDIILNNAL
nr:hypothetical protein Ef18B006LT_11420 [Escherichia fergusonii]